MKKKRDTRARRRRPLHKPSEAWRTLMAVRNAERAVVRAASAYVGQLAAMPRRSNSHYYTSLIRLREKEGRLTVAVDRLDRARAAERKRKRVERKKNL